MLRIGYTVIHEEQPREASKNEKAYFKNSCDKLRHALLSCCSCFGAKHHRWWNLKKDAAIMDILWPFMNGQVIKAKYKGEPSLLNLGIAKYLRIFKTNEKLSGSNLKEFKANDCFGKECTSELIREAKFDKASQRVKSLLQKLASLQKHQIFVIMKFNDPILDSAYEAAIKIVGKEFDYTVLRIDEVQDSGKIPDQILDAIAESEIVLADLTGSRPNCYFETGFAMAAGKELILTISSKEKDGPHFDLAGYRFIKWSSNQQLRRKLRERLQSIQDREQS